METRLTLIGMSNSKNACPYLRQIWFDCQIIGLAWFLLLFYAMKTVLGKVRRSGVYYLMTKAGPLDEERNARADTWGSIVVVVLLLAIVGLVRLLLTA